MTKLHSGFEIKPRLIQNFVNRFSFTSIVFKYFFYYEILWLIKFIFIVFHNNLKLLY